MGVFKESCCEAGRVRFRHGVVHGSVRGLSVAALAGLLVAAHGGQSPPAQAAGGPQTVVAGGTSARGRPAQGGAAAVDGAVVRVAGRAAQNPDWAWNAAQARLLARRAATVDAYRRIAEQVHGVSVAISRGWVGTEVRGVVRGARIVEIRRGPDGIAEVDATLDLRDRRAVGW